MSLSYNVPFAKCPLPQTGIIIESTVQPIGRYNNFKELRLLNISLHFDDLARNYKDTLLIMISIVPR